MAEGGRHHTLVKGHEKIKLVLTKKCPPCCPPFIEPPSATRIAGRERSSTVLARYDYHELQE